MVTPIVFENESFQGVWLNASRNLSTNGWNSWNIIGHINNPIAFNQYFHNQICAFHRRESLISPRDVCYTIFPYGLYRGRGHRNQLYSSYINRFFPRKQDLLRRRRNGIGNWGTYFHRMISYLSNENGVNQLENIINAINNRRTTMAGAYTIVIKQVGTETVRRMGGPCLNYIAIQLESCDSPRMGLLATYRNHDFLVRTYGNYWGLCRLLRFLCEETEYSPGPITCISSHAYVSNRRTSLRN